MPPSDLNYNKCIQSARQLLNQTIMVGYPDERREPTHNTWSSIIDVIISLLCQSRKLIRSDADAEITVTYSEIVEMIDSGKPRTIKVGTVKINFDLQKEIYDEETVRLWGWVGYAWIRALMHKKSSDYIAKVTSESYEHYFSEYSGDDHELVQAIIEDVPYLSDYKFVGSVKSRIAIWLPFCRVLEKPDDKASLLRIEVKEFASRLRRPEGLFAVNEFLERGRQRGCLAYSPYRTFEDVLVECPANLPELFIETLGVVRVANP